MTKKRVMEGVETEAKKNYFEVTPDHCSAKVAKGASAEGLPSHILVMDTGMPWVPEAEKRHPKTQEDMDALYRETISRGIIDHHGIDTAVLELPNGIVRRCATKMVADFPEEVLAQVKDRSVSSVTAHFDSDLDSISSTYLAKALVQSGDAKKMPKITRDLAELTNLVDYGRFDEQDPDKYAHSLPGLFGGLKRVLSDQQRAEAGAVYGDASITDRNEKMRLVGEINAKFAQLLVDKSFELLNACEQAATREGSIDFKALDPKQLSLSDKLQAALQKGIEHTRQEFADFDEAFKGAERTTATVTNKEGTKIEVPLLVFGASDKLSPLAITNMAYTRTPPETIVVVFAGRDRKYGGDHYDIGIKPETSALFTLQELFLPVNAAEAAARKKLVPDLDDLAEGTVEANEEQQAALDHWKKNPYSGIKTWADVKKIWGTPRKGFETAGHGDPSVVVAGGSLLAASNTALLDAKQLAKVVKTTLKSPK